MHQGSSLPTQAMFHGSNYYNKTTDRDDFSVPCKAIYKKKYGAVFCVPPHHPPNLLLSLSLFNKIIVHTITTRTYRHIIFIYSTYQVGIIINY